MSSRVAYAESVGTFYEDYRNGLLVEKIREGVQRQHVGINPDEVIAWQNNGAHLKDLLGQASVSPDSYIAFEVFCPFAGKKRIDCMMFGTDEYGKKHIDHIELKQWNNASVTAIADCGVFQRNEVQAVVNQCPGIHKHPSEQAYGYQQNLLCFMPVFENGIELQGFAYCYNYSKTDIRSDLFNCQYQNILEKCPLYTGSQNDCVEFASILNRHFSGGHGLETFRDFDQCGLKQTRLLMNAVADMLKGQSEFVLVGDQQKSADAILDIIRQSKQNPVKKYAIVIKGGPGTGKTVIALNLLAKLAKEENTGNILFATRSSALRDTLRSKLRATQTGAVSASELICPSIFQIYPHGHTQCNEKGYSESQIDVLIIDEAHRIERLANSMGSGTTTYMSQIAALLYCAKVSIFFIDDHQATCSSEIGFSSSIISAANDFRNLVENDWCAFSQETTIIDRPNANTMTKQRIDRRKMVLDDKENTTPQNTDFIVETMELTTQFRCNGSNNYLDWLDAVLYDDNRTGIQIGDEYEFGVLNSPFELEQKIRSLDSVDVPQKAVARLVAGYCWEWSEYPIGDGPNKGDLKKDVRIGDWAMPWETNKHRAYGTTNSGIPRERLFAPSAKVWASDPRGINQIGCVPSAQGFEFDYVGVILGPDISFDPTQNKIVTKTSFMVDSEDNDGRIVKKEGTTHGVGGERADTYIRNIYRVLMSRGKKGCYIYCCDPNLGNYFRRITQGPNHLVRPVSPRV